VVATQVWHHLYLGGGLCDLPYSAEHGVLAVQSTFEFPAQTARPPCAGNYPLKKGPPDQRSEPIRRAVGKVSFGRASGRSARSRHSRRSCPYSD
jgi:hypothetical protein